MGKTKTKAKAKGVTVKMETNEDVRSGHAADQYHIVVKQGDKTLVDVKRTLTDDQASSLVRRLETADRILPAAGDGDAD
jgi:hypothetical protein